MAKYHGNNGVFESGANAFGELTSFEITSGARTADSSSMGETWEDHEVGKKFWSGSLELRYDHSDTGQGDVTEGTELTITAYPTGNTTGHDELSGTATVTEITRSTNHDGIVSMSVNVLGKGALTTASVA